MLGPPKSRDLDEPIRVSLNDLVPPSHFYRHLERTLDLAFVRDLVRGAYAEIGRPSIDPVVFFKLQLILFFEGLRSERQLMRVVADRLSLRWHIGYALSEALPDHSSLTRIRERYGVEVFRRFFDVVVEQCIAAGLVWGKELYVDSTDVDANASIDSLQPRFAVEAHLARLFEEKDERGGDDPVGESGPTHVPVALTEEARSDLAKRAADRHDWIGEMGRPDRTRTSGPYRRTADYRASSTDLDASPLRPGGSGVRLGYHDHYVVDGGRARIILTVLVTPAEVQDNQPAVDLLWRTRFRWKLHPRQVTADTKYGALENIVAIEDQLIRAYMPLSAAGRKPGLFRDPDFVYDRETDTYRCPGKETLRFISQCEQIHRRVYEAPSAACAICSLRAQCTTSQRGRRIGRSLDETYLERVRGYHQTEPFAKAMRKRKVWVEPLFAEAKEWHGLRRFRLRGLEKVNIQCPGDRGRAESEASPQQPGLGSPPVAEWGSWRDTRRREPGFRLTTLKRVVVLFPRVGPTPHPDPATPFSKRNIWYNNPQISAGQSGRRERRSHELQAISKKRVQLQWSLRSSGFLVVDNHFLRNSYWRLFPSWPRAWGE
jgi:transposase